MARQHAGEHGGGQEREGEFAARRKQQRGLKRRSPLHPEGARQRKDDRRLDRNEPEGVQNDGDRIGDNRANVEPRADGHEEQPQQQALEGLDGDFDLAPEFGFRQQQAGDEGAEPHGETRRRRHQRLADHDEQAGGHEQFRKLRGGDETKQRAQQQAPEDDEPREREEGGHKGIDGLQHAEAAVFRLRENGDVEQRRRHHQILQQQDGEGDAARRLVDAPAFRQHRHDHGRRGHGQSHAHQYRRRGTDAEPVMPHRRQHRRGNRDLRESQAENEPAQPRQTLPGQFETDHEQQEDEAEFRKLRHALDIRDREEGGDRMRPGEAAETMRSQRRAGDQEAQHRADAQPMKERHDDARGREKHQRLAIGLQMQMCIGHKASRARLD